MKGISINGNKLHEIMMPLVPYKNSNSLVSLRYPKGRILFEQQDDGLLKLNIPSNLALEMYRIGILPQDKNHSFPVSISGKSIGKYKVTDFLYSHKDLQRGMVFISLQKQ